MSERKNMDRRIAFGNSLSENVEKVVFFAGRAWTKD